MDKRGHGRDLLYMDYMISICTSSLFTLNLSSGTRGHACKIIKQSVNTNICSHFFTNTNTNSNSNTVTEL